MGFMVPPVLKRGALGSAKTVEIWEGESGKCNAPEFNPDISNGLDARDGFGMGHGDLLVLARPTKL